MSLKSRLKKKFSKASKSASGFLKRTANKLPQVKAFKAVKSMFKPEDDEAGDEGMRSEAAKRLLDTKRQAGSGQISFTTEEEVL